ncbi:MAG: GTPase HflX [Acidobacteriaceae bacterium]|nr:GTPase HflX [Acidobacteriaceae bacterium]
MTDYTASKNHSGANRLKRSAEQERELLLARQEAIGEQAVLVCVDFSSGRPKLSPVASQARAAAAIDDAAEGLGGAGQVQPPAADLDFDAALAEFQELARSAGATIAAVIVQRRAKPDAATLVGGGKLDEIVATVASTGASLVLFDHDLTPSQARNVEARLPVTVIDRTQLILDIFARHARTREGMLQVELAQLEYSLPRIGGKGKTMSQTGGGIGTRGPGETQLEVDKRKIRGRLDRIKQQLEAVRRIRRQQRGRREAVPVPTVALVGYTNAGKSTLFNAVTGAEVLASERMFATLDPKLRQLTLPSRRKVLLSDTVGFLRHLPHALVTSFRATLEEVERAELLVHVRDAASPTLEEQKAQVEIVLNELGVGDKPTLQVLNKIDLLEPNQRVFGPGEIGVSALSGEGLQDLLTAIDAAMTADPLLEVKFRIPQAEGRVISGLERGANISHQRFEGNLVYFTAHGPGSLLERYRKFWVRDE